MHINFFYSPAVLHDDFHVHAELFPLGDQRGHVGLLRPERTPHIRSFRGTFCLKLFKRQMLKKNCAFNMVAGFLRALDVIRFKKFS